MKISTLGRHLREGSRSVIRNGWMSFASISSIAISLFILGLFYLLFVNVHHLTEQVESQVEISVFLDVNVSDETIARLRTQIEAIDNVKEVVFVSKQEGLEWMRQQMGEENLRGLDGENNPLNDKFEIEVIEPRQVEAVAEQIRALNDDDNGPIIRINYGKDIVDKLFRFTTIIRNVGLALVAALALTAMFLISNTIKLTIMSRSREIKIMKLVGATNSFIRWPFFVEGALLGLIGSAIPTGLLAYGYKKLMGSQSTLDFLMLSLKPFHEVVGTMVGVLFLIGIVIGIWGTTVSVRKYLKA